MNLLLLGGAGKTAARLLLFLRMGRWDRIVLCDREGEHLCRMAMDFPSLPLSFRFLDLEDGECLRRRMGEADLVVNCAGPVGGGEERVMEAALEAGKPYLSPGEGEEGWKRVRLLEGRAKAKGVPLVYGAGVSPGLTGLMASALARRFTSLREVGIFIRLGRGEYGKGLVDQLARGIEVGGKGPAALRFPFPPGGEERPAFPLRHPEASRLAERLGVPARAWVAFTEPAGFPVFYTLAWARRESHPFYRWLAEAATLWLWRERRVGPQAVVAAWVRGAREGVPWEEATGVRGDYYLLSAAALSCALDLVTAGKVAPGVYLLEDVAGWSEIIPRLRSAGAELFLGEGGMAAGAASRSRSASGR